MAKLLLNGAGGPAQELHLRPGVSRLGRNEANDIQVEHPSVSSFHCEITCTGDSVIVKDLNSTNGTFVDRLPIQESVLGHGQRLQFGSVEMVLDAPTAPAAVPNHALVAPKPAEGGSRITHHASPPPPPTSQSSTPNTLVPAVPVAARPRLSVHLPQPAPAGQAASAPPPVVAAPLQVPPPLRETEILRPGGPCKYHPRTQARWTCNGCHLLFCDLCVSERPGAVEDHQHKFCRTCGSACSPVAAHLEIPEMMAKSFFEQLPGVFAYPFKKNGLMLMGIGTVVFGAFALVSKLPFSGYYLIFGTGYFLCYMQRILTASGYGEEEMPGWPEITDFGEDIATPIRLVALTILACVAPGLACLIWGDDTVKQAAIPLFVFGAFYFPMALLAVGMTDNIFSLNPLVIIPSIAKVFVPYLVATIFVAILFGVYSLGRTMIEAQNIPLLPTILVTVLSLYFTTVQMRVLGILYFTNKDRLGWFNRTRGGKR